VLYIEDNDDDVYMLKMRLELLGTFEVLTAEDGEKGYEMAAAEQPRYYPDGPRNARR
jgi:CheY-like chemotaxis protein